jgi:hypothetical protein
MGIHVSCQFMPPFVGPLDNRRQLLADSRRNRWYDEKPGGSWTVPGGSRGEEKRKGKEERRGREGSRERRARARGAFCSVERRRICFTLQRILAPICEILKNNFKKILVWRRCREEGIELGGFWEDSMGLGSEEVEEDVSAASGGGRKRGSADFELLSSSLEVFLQSFQVLGLKEENVFFFLFWILGCS